MPCVAPNPFSTRRLHACMSEVLKRHHREVIDTQNSDGVVNRIVRHSPALSILFLAFKSTYLIRRVTQINGVKHSQIPIFQCVCLVPCRQSRAISEWLEWFHKLSVRLVTGYVACHAFVTNAWKCTKIKSAKRHKVVQCGKVIRHQEIRSNKVLISITNTVQASVTRIIRTLHFLLSWNQQTVSAYRSDW